jgi:2-keto-4-pentenoate hydratase/2-oxohepta-3-ene-1,7-dioic acid hydratase in catechol pathway
MKLRRVRGTDGLYLELYGATGWVAVAKCLEQIGNSSAARTDALAADMLALLAAPQEVRDRIAEAADSVAADPADRDVVMPFDVRSFRDFMLYEAHAIAAARGFVNAFMPAAAYVVRAYEALTRRTFPKLRPHALWYRQPIYYMGNHLNIATDCADISIPSYTRVLDYELELGIVLAHPLRDATPAEAEKAIGGFVVLNDFSARDVQADEMASGFGPQKAKHFASAISSVLVTADEILPRWNHLKARVHLNGALITETSTAGARWSLGEVLAHASRGEQLHPGELVGSGTLPGGSGIETGHLLKSGDRIEIAIDEIGSLSNRIV